jgi:hypothetical protein
MPLELPPTTPQDVLYRDLLRPRLTVTISFAPAPSGLIYSECLPEGAELRHGGEPTIRVLRDATSSSDSSGQFKDAYHIKIFATEGR